VFEQDGGAPGGDPGYVAQGGEDEGEDAAEERARIEGILTPSSWRGRISPLSPRETLPRTGILPKFVQARMRSSKMPPLGIPLGIPPGIPLRIPPNA